MELISYVIHNLKHTSFSFSLSLTDACREIRSTNILPPHLNHCIYLGGRGSILGIGKIFLLSTASRPALGPTQLLIQWVPEARSAG
jgi:hypothetical protein